MQNRFREVLATAVSDAAIAPAGLRHPALPSEVLADLRTDHAGEIGAVSIYRGLLFATRDPQLRAFAARHMQTEQTHLLQIETWLPRSGHSHLLPVWRMAGWLTGALPALFGPRAVYATIEAVEQFVDQHYGEQVQRLESQPALHALRETLIACQGDEVAHRDEAAVARGPESVGGLLRVWCRLVGVGSRIAVSVCRHI